MRYHEYDCQCFFIVEGVSECLLKVCPYSLSEKTGGNQSDKSDFPCNGVPDIDCITVMADATGSKSICFTPRYQRIETIWLIFIIIIL